MNDDEHTIAYLLCMMVLIAGLAIWAIVDLGGKC